MDRMRGKFAFAQWILLCCFSAAAIIPAAQAQAIPHFKVDPTWPKQLPNNWMMFNAPGMVVDKSDHIWVIQRPRQMPGADAAAAQTPPTGECCVPAPSVIEFDSQGNVVKSWGGPNFVPDWPILEHGLTIDGDGNFWVGGNYEQGPGAQLAAPIAKPKDLSLADRQVLKLSPEGKVLLEIGHPASGPANNQDTTMLGGPAEVFVDDAAHEVYIADGYMNRRVVVYDSKNGTFKRGWGAYGMPLSEIDNGKPPAHDTATPDKEFRGPMDSIDISDDGLVYVTDRTGDRVQVFTKEGKFQKEFVILPKTLGTGSAWTTTFSRDKQQKYLYVCDGFNGLIHVLNRQDGTELGTIGHKGPNAGQFNQIEKIVFDSHGNMYTTEVAPNSRIQKFVRVK
jgi:hypothetical protein